MLWCLCLRSWGCQKRFWSVLERLTAGKCKLERQERAIDVALVPVPAELEVGMACGRPLEFVEQYVMLQITASALLLEDLMMDEELTISDLDYEDPQQGEVMDVMESEVIKRVSDIITNALEIARE
eukprot:s473_g9.t1